MTACLAPQLGSTTTLAGNGTQGSNDGDFTNAQFFKPRGVAIDPKGDFLLVAVRAWPAPPHASSPAARAHLSEFRLPRVHTRTHRLPPPA